MALVVWCTCLVQHQVTYTNVSRPSIKLYNYGWVVGQAWNVRQRAVFYYILKSILACDLRLWREDKEPLVHEWKHQWDSFTIIHMNTSLHQSWLQLQRLSLSIHHIKGDCTKEITGIGGAARTRTLAFIHRANTWPKCKPSAKEAHFWLVHCLVDGRPGILVLRLALTEVKPWKSVIIIISPFCHSPFIIDSWFLVDVLQPNNVTRGFFTKHEHWWNSTWLGEIQFSIGSGLGIKWLLRQEYYHEGIRYTSRVHPLERKLRVC